VIERGWGTSLTLQGRYLQTTSTVKLNVKALGRTKLGKAQIVIGLLCTALKVTSCNL